MARIDKDIALSMFVDGETDSKIAARFGTSRQAVNLLRKAFVEAGTIKPLPNASRVRTHTPALEDRPNATPAPPPVVPREAIPPQPPTPVYPTYEQIGDWIINLIGNAGEVERLRQEDAVLRQRADGLLAEVLRLQTVNQALEQKLADLMARPTEYQTAIQRSRLPPPTTG